MVPEIYYFSGTGNTLYTAKSIAKKIDGKLIPIPTLINNKSIETKAEVIGIVYPVYYGELPLIVKKFVGLLENINSKYIFAVVTYGGSGGTSLKILNTFLQLKGGELAATYGIHMPQNAFLKPWENNEKILKKSEIKINRIAKNTNEKIKGEFYSNILLNPILILLHYMFKPLYKRSFMKRLGTASGLDFEELMYNSDKSYSITGVCNGCGICNKVCPVNNIEIINNKPVWLNHCENCLACYNWCPNKAIIGGIVQKNYYYHNNHIDISEIINQKKSL